MRPRTWRSRSRGISLFWWWSLLVILVTPTSATSQNLDNSDSSAHTTSIRVLDEPNAWLSPRQAPPQAPEPIPTPAAPAPTSRPDPAPILISIVPDSSTPSGSSAISNSTTASSLSGSTNPPSSSLPANTTSQSQSSSSSISSTSSTPSSISSFSPPKLTFLTFVPAIAAVSLILLLLFLWLLYGCCTRKPRRRIHGREWDLDRDGEELVCGPPYSHPSGLPEPDFEYGHEDFERGGARYHDYRYRHEEEEEEERLLKRPKRLHLSRWPSFNSPPTFDPSRGFHVPDGYGSAGGGENNRSQQATLMAVPPRLSQSQAGGSKSTNKNKSRSRTSHATQKTSRSWKSKHSSSSTNAAGPYKAPSRPAPPSHQSSSSTFLQLYSDSDSGHDKDKSALLDAPWESLRHKSIKRGILEQVKKGKERESKWMDSIRSGAGLLLDGLSGSARGSMRGGKVKDKGGEEEEEDGVILFDQGLNGDVGDLMEECRPALGKRKGHVRADSDLFIAPAAGVSDSSTSTNPVPHPSPTRADTRPLKITKSKTSKSRSGSRGYSSSSPTKPGFRRGFSWLKGGEGDDEPEAEDDLEGFELLQAPFSERKNRSARGSRSANSSPANVESNSKSRPKSNGVVNVNNMETLAVLPSRDVLPKSPSQIMSPPLESQMCFTPIPLSIARMPMPPDQGPVGAPAAPLSLGQVIDAGVVDGGGIITAPTPARLGSKSRSRSNSRPDVDQTPTKIPMPSKRRRFPVTADVGEYVEVGDFAPFRTPSPQKVKKKSRDGGPSMPTSMSTGGQQREREFEFFWTPKSLGKKGKKKEKEKSLGDYYAMTSVDA